MDLSRCRDERIHRMQFPATRLAASNHPPPFVGNGTINSNDSCLKTQRQVAAQPLIESLTSGTHWQAFDAAAKFSESDHTEKCIVFVNLGEPGNDSRVGPRFRPLGYNVGIEQIAHKSDLRSRSLARRTERLEPRSGEALKKSASVPRR